MARQKKGTRCTGDRFEASAQRRTDLRAALRSCSRSCSRFHLSFAALEPLGFQPCCRRRERQRVAVARCYVASVPREGKRVNGQVCGHGLRFGQTPRFVRQRRPRVTRTRLPGGDAARHQATRQRPAIAVPAHAPGEGKGAGCHRSPLAAQDGRHTSGDRGRRLTESSGAWKQ